MQEYIGFYLKRISESMDRKVNAEMRKFGLTVTQGRVLGFLHKRAGKSVTQKDVEQFMGATHATVSGVIQRLKKNGFIEVIVDESDRRAKKLSVTEKELAVHNKAQATRKALEQKMTTGMTEKEKNELLSVLKIMYENLNGSSIAIE